MAKPIGLQLYTIRDLLKTDFSKGLHEIATIGYTGIEASTFEKIRPEEAARIFKDLDLAVIGAHIDLPLRERANQVLDTMAALECRRLILPSFHQEKLNTDEQVRRACDQINSAIPVAEAHGFSIGFHNHWREFYKTREGHYIYQLMQQYLLPEIFFELDTYWIKTAGCDPAQIVAELGPRAPLLHIKDGPAVISAPQVAAGEGILDFPAILAAGKPYTEWLVVELDSCATDIMEAVRKSFHYLDNLPIN